MSPALQALDPNTSSARVVRARRQPVGEEHGEERHEDRAEEEQEALVAADVDEQSAERRYGGDEDDQQLLRRARKRVLQRDGGGVRVRERLVGLRDEECEERHDRGEAPRDHGGGKRSGIADVAGQNEHGTEREEPDVGHEVAEARPREGTAPCLREARVVGRETAPTRP